MAGEEGLEPPPYGPEPHVLPLDYSPGSYRGYMLAENCKRGKT